MKIDKTQDGSAAIHISGNRASKEEHNATRAAKNSEHKNVIFAGDLKLPDDAIGGKKREAARLALKALMDPYKNDKDLDQKVSDLKEKQRKLLDDANLAADQIKDLKLKKAGLKASYGIDDNSQEQKDLELLEKSIFSPDKMTDEDRKKLQSLGPLTDYQKDALKNDSMQKIYQQRVDTSTGSIMNLNQSITGIALERLKTHPMVDAQKEAAQILEAASKEVIAALLGEGKDQVDKTIEKNREDAEAKQKEQEGKDTTTNKTDDTTNKSAASSADDTGLSISEQTRQIQNAEDLKRAAEKQNLIEDELKGIVVDEKV